MTRFVVRLDLIQTLALVCVVLFAGYGLRRRIWVLDRYNLPAPVIGGFLFALVGLVLRQYGLVAFEFDTTLQTPLMIAFFTTIGFGASVTLLRQGGPLVLLFFGISSAVAVAQNVLGLAIASQLGVHPLLGVLAGSVTLTGGPATGLAFAPEFEKVGVPDAAPAALAAAMIGIVAGGIIGGPIGTLLISRQRLQRRASHNPVPHGTAAQVVEDRLPEPHARPPRGEDVEAYGLLKNLALIAVAMGIGVWLSAWASRYLTLPTYIGAMMVAALLRNLDDATGVLGASQRIIDDLGTVSLSLFLAMALMTLRLWQLAALALPLALILAAQVAMIAILAIVLIFRATGRDYDAAVMSSGFCGFMLGTTANAMANMEVLTQKYGASPKAFLVVPMVGAFFIDFTNALIITAFLNYWR
ncbi:MAG TPA: sodium/glutamate symporter [Vicinamibacterales bacterium]|nr:sodium/glutamate symporter [Vicinamibacterales bacterium]